MNLTAQQKKFALRQELLEKIFNGLQNQLGLGDDLVKYLKINRTVLFNVVISYFHDVERHKEFHKFSLVDETKQGAFTIKWVARLRPIQFDHKEQVTSKDILYINEIFALRCGLAFVKMSPSKLPEPLYYDMLYTLRYRCIDERLLFVWLATLVSAVNGDFKSDE